GYPRQWKHSAPGGTASPGRFCADCRRSRRPWDIRRRDAELSTARLGVAAPATPTGTKASDRSADHCAAAPLTRRTAAQLEKPRVQERSAVGHEARRNEERRSL